MTNGYLLLHGWQNRRPKEHWQHWLADELEAAGHRVAYPQLPDPDEPELDVWLKVLRDELAGLAGDERVVVAHSLSVLVWLHAVARNEELDVDRVLLAAPASAKALSRFPVLAPFIAPRLAPRQVAGVRLVGSDMDVWCPEGISRAFGGPLGLDAEIIPGGGHLSLDDGYGSWPSMLAWCLDPKTRIVPRGAA
jgi:predicted alpha/beta hydrolase family esterase